MREAIGGAWIMQLVIIFILIFVAFLALSLNYSKAFQMKNDMLTIIEEQEGMTENTIALINNYLSNNGYNVTKSCPQGSFGVANLKSQTYEHVTNSKPYYYCFEKLKSSSPNLKESAYYNVEIFFYFNLPVIGDVFKFTINGSTNDIGHPMDGLEIN